MSSTRPLWSSSILLPEISPLFHQKPPRSGWSNLTPESTTPSSTPLPRATSHADSAWMSSPAIPPAYWAVLRRPHCVHIRGSLTVASERVGLTGSAHRTPARRSSAAAAARGEPSTSSTSAPVRSVVFASAPTLSRPASRAAEDVPGANLTITSSAACAGAAAASARTRLVSVARRWRRDIPRVIDGPRRAPESPGRMSLSRRSGRLRERVVAGDLDAAPGAQRLLVQQRDRHHRDQAERRGDHEDLGDSAAVGVLDDVGDGRRQLADGRDLVTRRRLDAGRGQAARDRRARLGRQHGA